MVDKELLARADAILAHGPNTAYISRSSSQHVRDVVRDLRAALAASPVGGSTPSQGRLLDSLKRALCISSDLDHRPWKDIERAVAALASPPPRECEPVAWQKYIPEIVKNAMLTMWGDICGDTGCHPLDIEHGKGKFLTFTPRHWAQMTGDMAAKNIADLLASSPPRHAGGDAGREAIIEECAEAIKRHWASNDFALRDQCLWAIRALSQREAPLSSPQSDTEPTSLADWILKYLELECSLDPSYVSKADRATIINAIRNSRSPVESAVRDTWLVGGPDLKAMSGSVESNRVIQLHFHRPVNDKDRAWLLEAINEKILSEQRRDERRP